MAEGTRQYRLQELSVPRLLFALLRTRFTGTLTIPQSTPEPGTRTIWFRGGMPIFTDWVSPPDVLGEVLLAKAMLTPAAHQDGLLGMAREGGLLGQVLVRAGVLDRRSLAEALRTQCTRKLVHAFMLREGAATVQAVEHGKGVDDELAGQVNVLRLVLSGVSRHYDEARVSAEMADAVRGPLTASPAFAKYRGQFGFRDEDLVIVQQLQRGTTLAELAVPGLSRKRIAQIVYTLWACQMLLTAEQLSERTAAASAPANANPPQRPPPATPTARAPASTPRAPATAQPAAPPPARPPPSSTEEPKKVPRSMVQDEPAAAVDPAFERELAEFEAKLAANAHAFAIFDLDLDADRKSIRARWGQLSSRFHPDRLGPEGLGHLRSRVEPVFAALSEAHGVLSNQSEREELRRVIEAGGEPGKPGQDARSLVRNALEAEMLSRDADKLLKAGNFVRALELYERALALHPGEAEIQAAAAWCRYQVDGRTEAAATAALEILARAVDEQPKCARAHFYRGLVFLQQRQESAATRSFEDALKADRRFTDAERQLRALQLKKRAATEEREPAAKKKGGLRGLFTRKD